VFAAAAVLQAVLCAVFIATDDYQEARAWGVFAVGDGIIALALYFWPYRGRR
jgi:hypothetical protein